MRASAHLGFVLGLLAAGVSCRQIVGVDDRQFKPGGPPACGLPTLGATPGCAPCMMQEPKCCSLSNDCANSTDCLSLSNCLHACASGDAPCRAKCPARIAPDSVAPRQALESVEACREARCAAECNGDPWACVGQVAWSFPPYGPMQLPIRATLVQPSDAGVTPVAMSVAMGSICSISDPSCANPLASGMSNDQGIVILNVDARLHPPPLAVFVEYRMAGFLDTLVSLDTPPVSGSLDLGQITMETIANVGIAAMDVLHTTYDPARAIVAVLPYDCAGRPASLIAKVEFPDADAATKTLQPYPVTGEALAMNLPVNAPALLARVVARVWGKTRIVATASVVVRPGAKTLVYLNPTP